MGYQKVINWLDETTDQPFRFRAKIWVEINDKSKGEYKNSDIRFKTSMIRSNVCDYSDAYKFVKATITVLNTAAAGFAVNNTNKKAILKSCAPVFWLNNPNK